MFENKWQSVSFFIGILFLVLSIAFIVLVGFDYQVFLLGTFSATAFFVTYAAKQASQFKQANQLTSLLQRHENKLQICNKHLSPSYLNEPVEVEISQISSITILAASLSVQLMQDEQLNQFTLTGSTTEIKQRVEQLLTEQELQRISIE
ncbi:hypothetical protein [Pseudoalteromonas tunicata]|uniref:hypothetical protein n=1 Tax=Pseudoalteromonas tunicata TaxID=314281 RepID=UPI00273E8513|nr:hypothetical protein [Pseudoalteromonas tunicata]MDP4983569.1 hypothetical protein [Pseudoalteromonas tunicata]